MQFSVFENMESTALPGIFPRKKGQMSSNSTGIKFEMVPAGLHYVSVLSIS